MLRKSSTLIAAGICVMIACTGLVRAQEKMPVVASFSILADLVKQVGGERVQVTALVGENSDAHVYQPKPSDVATIGKAKLVVVNGLGFESWAERLIKSSRYSGETLTASRGIDPLKVRNATDPHGWQDPKNVRTYVGNIRDALSKVDPAGKADYEKNAAAYLAEIEKVETEVKTAWASIPKDQRRIITSHDAFAYYARAFDVVFIAPQGVSTESEPSARDVAALVRQIRQTKAKAVFIENMSSRRLMESISEQTGARVGGTLYSDALGGEAKTWLDMMRHNTKLLTEALK